VIADYEDYRRQAYRCQEAAQRSATPQLRTDWLNLACLWLEKIQGVKFSNGIEVTGNSAAPQVRAAA
jgi:hypothetical protein